MKDMLDNTAPSLQGLNRKDGTCLIYADQRVNVVKTNIKSKKNLFNAVTIGCAISSETGVTNMDQIEQLIHKSSGEHWGNVSGPYLIREGVYQCRVSYSMASIYKYEICKATPKECLFDAHLFLSYFYSQKISVVVGKESVENIRDAHAFVSTVKRGNKTSNDKPICSMLMGSSVLGGMDDDILPPPIKKKRTALC